MEQGEEEGAAPRAPAREASAEARVAVAAAGAGVVAAEYVLAVAVDDFLAAVEVVAAADM